ncbi:hypothetical protein PHYPSEUDO_000805 [Phytophthora pseudosyringae]|uniref:BZIP domain-containing protein n=1 Tax=Phytophthora pseudosyringae TaxID=221518 RepID=A0A8T1WF74_9STRA|nr:hypothetical protein PHYPSEUDO_000805 [Phytophthora pseudosyringae]
MDRISSIFARFEPTNSSRFLTSDVIGHVRPRASVGGGDVFLEPAKFPRLRTSLPTTRTSLHVTPVAPQQPSLGYQMEVSLSRRMRDVAICPSWSGNPFRQEPVSSLASSAPTQPLLRPTSRTIPSVKTIQSSAPGAPKIKRKRIRIKTARRREQCRTNQARYRQKQMESVKTLEVTVEHLQREIPMLEMQHSRLLSNANPSAWFIIVEYFHLFRNGVQDPDQAPHGPEAWLQKSEADQQLVFLQSSMAADVMLGEQRGVDALVEQWKRHTSYFDDLQFQLEHMARISEDFISATAFLNVTLSESTLQHVFPWLLAAEEGGGRRTSAQEEDKAAILRSKLLGQRLFLPCRLCFEWDGVAKRIVRMENTVDVLPSLMQVLGSLEDAAFVLEHALIAQDGTIGRRR